MRVWVYLMLVIQSQYKSSWVFDGTRGAYCTSYTTLRKQVYINWYSAFLVCVRKAHKRLLITGVLTKSASLYMCTSYIQIFHCVLIAVIAMSSIGSVEHSGHSISAVLELSASPW